MTQIEELDIRIMELEEQGNALNKERLELKRKRDQMRIHPLAKKYEGKFFGFRDKSYGYVKKLTDLDDDMISFDGLYCWGVEDDDDFFSFCREGEAFLEDMHEISKEEFVLGISGMAKALEADLKMLL